MNQEYRASIPDEHMPDWIKTLRSLDFTPEEIDSILGHLNDTYLEQMYGKELVNEFMHVVGGVHNFNANELSSEEKDRLRKVAIQHMRENIESGMLTKKGWAKPLQSHRDGGTEGKK